MTFENPLGEYSDTQSAPESSETSQDARGMRKTIEKQAAQIRRLEKLNESEAGEFRERSMSQAFEALGLDPETGIGKAVAVTFEGEPEGLAAFAESEFGYVPSFEHPYARQIANGQAQLDEMGKTAGSVAAATQADDLAKAEARGDYATTMAIKGAQMERMLRP